MLLNVVHYTRNNNKSRPQGANSGKIRHWEVTARVQKAFLSFFWICLIFLIFLLTWREHAWVSWSVRRGRARSCECVVRMDSTIAHWAAPLDRETGPDLTWQWTLAVVVCAALAGVFKKRKYEIEFN